MVCLNCGKKLNNRQTKYCCPSCQIDYQYKQYIERWKQGKESGLKGECQISNYVRRYLLEKNNFKCEKCGWGETNPYTGKIPLEIHHKDGDYKRTTEDNLEVLCPNCHSLTENYKNANSKGREGREKYYKKSTNHCIDCGKEISYGAIRCADCYNKSQRKTTRPDREQLKEMIRNIPFTQIAKEFGVSDNAVKKWCDSENLPRTKTEIKKYSDEEWAQI